MLGTAACVTTIVVVMTSMAFADPSIQVTNLGPNADGNLEWRVDIVPDASLFTNGTSSLAAELGFEFGGSALLDAAINESVMGV